MRCEKKMETEQQQREYLERFRKRSTGIRNIFPQEVFRANRHRRFERIGDLRDCKVDEHRPERPVLQYRAFFPEYSAGYDGSAPESYTDTLAAVQDKVTQYHREPLRNDFIPLECHDLRRFGQGAARIDIAQRTSNCTENIESRCAMAGMRRGLVYRLRHAGIAAQRHTSTALTEASRILSYRYLCPRGAYPL